MVMLLQESSATLLSVQVKLARPDVASEAELLSVTGLRYQLFCPIVPLKVPLIVGGCESTFAERDPISELSRKEESAQYMKLLLPWFRGTLQLELIHAKFCPFSRPSIAKMTWPGTGSIP